MKLTDEYLTEVLNNYHHCLEIESCSTCRANNKIIPSGETTFCEFLRKHREVVENKIINAMDNVL